MELKDFVSETLKQIIQGVREAQDFAAKENAIINPSADDTDRVRDEIVYRGQSNLRLQHIDFDVAVTTSEGTQTQGGFGVFVGPIGAGSKGQSDASSSAVSRIKFYVPLALPKSSN